MKTRKPKALTSGSTLAVISPASIANPETVMAGVRSLEALGYRVKVMPHALDRGPLNFAGTIADRVSDLHAAFRDPEVDAILCTRGGWGCAELLEHLRPEWIGMNPKALIGYSDVTSLHVWMRSECGLVSFQGPMVASDFSKVIGPDRNSWNSALVEPGPWSAGSASGLRVLHRGTAEGVLSGGCLSIYVESLGTPYAPVAEGGVLFFEDIGTKPWQWDRMLLHLKLAGMFEGVSGIVFGDMISCGGTEEMAGIEAAILHSLRWFGGPIGIGLRSGHVDGGNVTLPFGVKVRLDFADAGNPQMHFVESSVEG